MSKYSDEEVDALAEAMWQLLDDMGKAGSCVCMAAKADARIAFEPFRKDDEDYIQEWMSLDAAKKIREECDG